MQLFTAPPAADQTQIETVIGDHGTRRGEVAATRTTAGGDAAVRVDAATFHADGTDLVQNPGPIDRPPPSIINAPRRRFLKR